MKRKLPTSFLILAVAAAGHGQEQGPLKIAGSLFNAGSADGVIVSRNAMHKGDLLTIVVSESATGSTSATTSATKKDSTQYSTSLPAVGAVTNQFLTGLFKNIATGALGGGNTAANSAVAGAGSSSTQTAFSTKVSVVVMEVLPNGNFIVEGKRTFKMNKQTQTLLVQGIVRRDDVRPDNSVLSANVADFRLVADGKGLIADRQRTGLLTKLLSWIF